MKFCSLFVFLGAVQVLLETVNKMAIVIDDKANDNQNQDNEYFLQGLNEKICHDD